MKKLILSLVAIATISLASFGQAPEGFKYQAVVRDAGNIILNNQAVGIRLTIQQGSIGGTAVYTETFMPTTNGYGLVNLEIGTGTSTDDFTLIDWSNGLYFIETAVDVTGGTSYAVMGTSQLMSVPYALYAKSAENVTNDAVDDADSDPNNELQVVSLSNDTLYLSNGGQVYLGTYGIDLVDDADADPTNELQDWSSLPNIPAGFADDIDDVDDADADSNNEIQTISRTGTTVTLSGGGTFEDSVGVYTAGTGIDITNGVISAVNPIYTIGLWPELGGYVFWISSDGKHGLVAETQDQGIATWYEAPNLISDPSSHSINGQKFRDWRLPSKYELNEMYLVQGAIGGFTPSYYLCYTESSYDFGWVQDFWNGALANVIHQFGPSIRAVREF